MASPSLLIVDDEEKILSSLKRELKNEGYPIRLANSGQSGLELMRKHQVGVVLSDHMMPEMDGVQFLESAKEQSREAIRILMTGYGSLENAMVAINRSKIFGYLTKPWTSEVLKNTIAGAFDHYKMTVENRQLQELTFSQNEKLKTINENLDDLVSQRTLQLEEAVREGILMLALAAEAKDDGTGKHVHRIQDLTRAICTSLGLTVEETDDISFFSIMHDVGKIHIPDAILKKEGPLNEKEWAVMTTHAIAGEKILGSKPFYQTAREIARSHHERWDGTGYPDGLKGKTIPLAARIVAICDVFDALVNDRPYKKAWSVKKALGEVERLSGKNFDPKILEAFLRLQNQKGYN